MSLPKPIRRTARPLSGRPMMEILQAPRPGRRTVLAASFMALSLGGFIALAPPASAQGATPVRQVTVHG
jgi:hypothetical protein